MYNSPLWGSYGNYPGYVPPVAPPPVPTAPPQMPTMTPPQNTSNIPFVNGIEGARAYQIAPNSTVMLMDSDSSRFFTKQSNALGQSVVRAFRFEEETGEAPRAEYVKADDFAAFRADIEAKIAALGKGDSHE